MSPDSRPEFEQITRIRQRIPPAPGVLVGIGDDTAVLQSTRDHLLATVDMLVDGIHFDLRTTSPERIGRKAMNVNLSDIAAMAGQPRWALVAVALPSGHPQDLGDRLFSGLAQAAAEFDVILVGGDTNRSPTGLVISVTVLGEAFGGRPILRSGAKPGDWLLVTGHLGYSLAGRHLDFTPRVAEARRLVEVADVHAMLDLSDGLSSDVFHLAEESRVGVELYPDRLPIAPCPAGWEGGQDQIPDQVRTAIDHALQDGEDFELLFAVSPEDGERLVQHQPLNEWGTPITHIGTVLATDGVWLVDEEGRHRPLAPGGYVHRWDGPAPC